MNAAHPTLASLSLLGGGAKKMKKPAAKKPAAKKPSAELKKKQKAGKRVGGAGPSGRGDWADEEIPEEDIPETRKTTNSNAKTVDEDELENAKREARADRFKRCLVGDPTKDPLGNEHVRDMRRRETDGATFAEAIGKVSLSKKLTKKQLDVLFQYLQARDGETSKENKPVKFDTASSMFSSEGMRACNDLLCRWPRPSEIFLLAKNYYPQTRAGPALRYYKMVVPLREPRSSKENVAGKLIGRGGVNLLRLSEDYQLLYAWVDNGELRMYARTITPLHQMLDDELVLSLTDQSSAANKQLFKLGDKPDW